MHLCPYAWTWNLTQRLRFWWLDLHTFIMEPSISLQSHIFNQLQNVTYRDINVYNPLNITHPPSEKDFFYLDETSKSAVGDDRAEVEATTILWNDNVDALGAVVADGGL